MSPRRLALKFMIILISSLFMFHSHALFEIDENKALLQSEKNTISIFETNVNSVVHISNIRKVRRGSARGFFFFHRPSRSKERIEGEGTGFVWDKNGHIVTNYHVIRGGTKFMVKFHKDPKKYEAKLIGSEPNKDIAVLKLVKTPKRLTPVKVGSSDTIKVGQKAIAIGNPFGLDSTITQGIVSAKGRAIRGITGIEIFDMIQTDSSINPGNSGGPLINSRGEVIGVNTMIYSHSGTSAGVGFAVPIDAVKKIAPQLIKYGQVKRAGFGIAPIEKEMLAYQYDIEIEKGLPIARVFEGSSADKAGLRGITGDEYEIYLGDIILKVDNKDINSYDDIFNILYEYNVGDTVKVTFLRKGKKKTVDMKLQLLQPRD